MSFPYRFVSLLARLSLLLPALCLFPYLTSAQGLAVGTIEGRVFNPESGEYLESVRITVEGTSLEVFTDTSGQYRLTNVPAGPVTLKAFRTGAVTQTQVVSVAGGQITVQHFNLTGSRTKLEGDGTVKLDAFVVAASKEMDGAAIAINTQRFASNVVNVVSANEFGPVADGGVGEVLKSMPGMAISRGGFGDAYLITMNGVPPNNVPVTIGGFNLANASSDTSRAVGMQQVSINNFSRIEVIHTPTPESSGSALAGSVNMVPISAFERSWPVFNISVSAMFRDNEHSLEKTPGPLRQPERKVHPALDFSAIVPVNKRFGFTFSGSASSLYTAQSFSQMGWRGGGLATNGGTLPDTTAGAPYLTDYAVADRPRQSSRVTLGTTLDYRITSNDRLSFSFQYGFSDAQHYDHTLNFFVNRVLPGDFTSRSTQGFAGAGEVRLTNNFIKVGGAVYTPSLTYRHDGPVWMSEVGVGVSRSDRYNKNVAEGIFNNVQARRQGVTVSFDDIFYLRPGVIRVTDGATGAPIDPYNLSNYTLNTANGNSVDAFSVQRTAFANLRRSFYGRVPVTLKAGVDFRQSVWDNRTNNPTYTFVGSDGRPNTSDDNAAAFLDESFSQRTAPFGFPRIQWFSNNTLYDQYRTNPRTFTVNDATSYTRAVELSKYANEIISSSYFRGDVHFFDRRLKVVGGVRAEQTNVEGQGRLIDPTQNYMRDAAGHFVLGASELPVPITTDPLAAAQLTNVDRGLRAEKEYLRWFPSLNASYNLRENLIARAGYYWSVGRPDFGQYAGSLTLPNTANPPGPGNRISVNNAGIKAWSARSVKASLEYYFEGVGLLSVAAFQREIKNFFGTTVTRATPEFLGLYGLDPTIYGAYDVNTQYNVPTPVRMSGLDFSYKQALTFFPRWARGVQVFANASAQRATGEASNNFAGYIPRTFNWGLSLSRTKYSVRMNWNYAGRARQGVVAAGRSIEAGTYTWGSKRLIIDLSGEYTVYKKFAFFINLSNLGDAPIDLEMAGPSTPSEAQFRQRMQNGAQWLFGIKSSF